jgi:hypothetical protein
LRRMCSLFTSNTRIFPHSPGNSIFTVSLFASSCNFGYEICFILIPCLLPVGFRKLRSDPILTTDVDPRTANFVRFYHEKFQKDRPDLLQDIKRATKSDQQSKDDVDSLKCEVSKLREIITQMAGDMDRKLAEMSFEYNRRITSMSGEYDKLTALVQQVIVQQQAQQASDPQQAAALLSMTEQLQQANRVPADLMQSLTHVAAMNLQNQLRAGTPSGAPAINLGSQQSAFAPGLVSANGTKRSPPDSEGSEEHPSSKHKSS